MKLHDALRKLCNEYGNTIIQKAKVVYLLSDLGAFGDHPELRKVMKLIVSGGYARKFCSLSHLKDFEDFFDHAEDDIDKLYDLADENLAGYAVDSIAFAFGLIDDPAEMDSSLRAVSRADNGGNAAASPAIPVTLAGNGEMFEECRREAEQGDAGAQCTLGLMYFSGLNVREDSAEGIRWLRKSAEQGYDMAQASLGNIFYRGDGAAQDYGEALKWFRMAAEQGNAAAAYWLGRMYQCGEGVPQDYREAYSWYLKAAEQEHSEAETNIGVMYTKGVGVEKDYGEAMKWLRRAAEHGSVAAMNNIGNLYMGGVGVAQDYFEARRWLRTAGLTSLRRLSPGSGRPRRRGMPAPWSGSA